MSAGIDYGLGRTNIDKLTGIRYGVISCNSITQAWADSAEAEYGDPHCPKCGNEAIDLNASERDGMGNRLDGSGEDDVDMDAWEHARGECQEYACKNCKYLFGSESAFGDDPQGYSVTEDGYEVVSCLDNDAMIIKAPFYTFAPFCSPCVPGAGNLDGADKPHVELFPLVQSTGITLWRSVVDGRVECIGGTYLDALNAANAAIAATTDVKAYAFGHDWFDPPVAPYRVYGVISGRECFPDDWYGR